MHATGSPRTSELTIPSVPDRITQVDEFLESSLREAQIQSETISDIAIAVTELVNNAIDHGNAGDPEKSVTIQLSIGAKDVVVNITDEGGGFDEGRIADPLAQENLMREVGRGVFIVRHLMDEVEIKTIPGRGTTVRIKKVLNTAANS